MNLEPVLEIKNLCTHFLTNNGALPAVNGVSLSIEKGKILALVGESGCGKTMTAMSILRLIPPPGKIIEGKILMEGNNLLDLSEKKMRNIRGKDISLIFQEPGLALNPVYTIGNQIAEVIKIHRPIRNRLAEGNAASPMLSGTVSNGVKSVKDEVIRLLKLVKIPEPEHRLKSFPHQLSGGMQQRVLIAMAIACRPKLLIADEPTTALDVTIQAQILMLIKELTETLNMSVLLITHDLGIVAEIADSVAIMYAGKIVEYADVYELFKNPLHPYTKGLLASIPKLNEVQDKLHAIPGNVPDLARLPKGCAFHPRCSLAIEQCKAKVPALKELGVKHLVSCDIM